MSSPTPYPDLNTVLDAMIAGMQSVLGNKLIGVYLQGSFAVGDFDGHSDVDFVSVVAEPMTAAEVAALQEFHARLFEMEIGWAQHLEGSYFPQDVLQDYQQTGKLLWYLDNGSNTLIQSDHCNMVLVRWVVREHGVQLAGPAPKTLVDPIPVNVLRQEILETICYWGQEILDNPDRFRNRFYQGYLVLNFCRMLHDLRRGYPGSKRAGAEWAKTVLDTSWHGLIDRAWACRPQPELGVRQPPDAEDYEATLELIRLIIELSREIAPFDD